MTRQTRHIEATSITLLGPCVTLKTSGLLTVLEVFDRSIYLRDLNGSIYCLGAPDLPMGPFNLHCTVWPDFQRLAHEAPIRGMLVGNDGSCLSFPSGIRLSYIDAERWHPNQPAPCTALSVSRSLERIRRMSLPQNAGLGRLLPMIFGLAPEGQPHDALDAELLKAGAAALTNLCDWLDQDETDGLTAAVHHLIGLGPGLTPSGDDVLAGMMFCFNVFDARDLLAPLERAVFDLAQFNTNSISHAYLQAASRGFVSAALHDVINALCLEAPDLEYRVRSLAEIGHSSGFDALLGTLLAVSALHKRAGNTAAPWFSSQAIEDVRFSFVSSL